MKSWFWALMATAFSLLLVWAEAWFLSEAIAKPSVANIFWAIFGGGIVLKQILESAMGK